MLFKLGIEPIENAATAAEASGQQPSLLGVLLKTAFPNLTLFAVIATVLTIPVGIFIGHLHMRRTGAFAAEASIGTEANPYVYKAVPGKEQEVFLPLSILTVRGLKKVLERGDLLTPQEKAEFDQILATADKLLAGHVVKPSKRKKDGMNTGSSVPS